MSNRTNQGEWSKEDAIRSNPPLKPPMVARLEDKMAMWRRDSNLPSQSEAVETAIHGADTTCRLPEANSSSSVRAAMESRDLGCAVGVAANNTPPIPSFRSEHPGWRRPESVEDEAEEEKREIEAPRSDYSNEKSQRRRPTPLPANGEVLPGAYAAEGRAFGQLPVWIRRAASTMSRSRSRSIARSQQSLQTLPPVVSAHTVDDTTVIYAEDVSPDRSKELQRTIFVVAVVACLCIVALATGLGVALNRRNDNNEDSSINPLCLETPLEGNVLLHCTCTGSAEGFSSQLSDEGRMFYEEVRQQFWDEQILTLNFTMESCLPQNQALLTFAGFERFGISFEETDMATLPFLKSTYAVLLVYFSLGGHLWQNNTGWLETGNICDWFGLECSFLLRVSSIRLPANGLQGTIPPELKHATFLRGVDLSNNNNITGTIPRLDGIRNLNVLSLSDTQLTGTIPSEFGLLDQLDSLDLSNNILSGSIPSELGNLDLRYLKLSSNRLGSTLPSELGTMKRLADLVLHSNELTGTIPTEFGGNLFGLLNLDLSYNRISGTIPTSIGALPKLELTNLINTTVHGPVPESFCDNRPRDGLDWLLVSCEGSEKVDANCSCCGSLVQCVEWFLPDSVQNEL